MNVRIEVKEYDVSNFIQKTVMAHIEQHIRSTVMNTVGPEGAAQIEVTITGESLESYTLNMSGPEDLIQKVRAAFSNE